MGARNPAHPGQRYAAERREAESNGTEQCAHCRGELAAEHAERVEHVIPLSHREDPRTVRYCSPSCFIREMEQLSGLEPGAVRSDTNS